MTDFNEAIRLDGKSALSYVNRGLVFQQKGDNEHALA